eukprot:SAG25_NODE_363_length_9141_cov_28.612586_5_plen_104_part_00
MTTRLCTRWLWGRDDDGAPSCRAAPAGGAAAAAVAARAQALALGEVAARTAVCAFILASSVNHTPAYTSGSNPTQAPWGSGTGAGTGAVPDGGAPTGPPPRWR